MYAYNYGYGYHHPHHSALSGYPAAPGTHLWAEEAVRREEELLQLRLGQLRRSRLAPQPSQTLYYQPDLYAAPTPRPYNHRLHQLRHQLEEEERLEALEGLYQRHQALKEIERSRRHQRELEEELESLRLARTRNIRSLQLAEEAQRPFARPLEPSSLAITEPGVGKGPSPREELVGLILQLPSNSTRVPNSTQARGIDASRKPSLVLNCQRRPTTITPNSQSKAAQAVDLGSFLQQLGGSAPMNSAEIRKEVHPIKQTSISESKSKAEESTDSSPIKPRASSPVVDLTQIFKSMVREEAQVAKTAQESIEVILKEQLEKRLNNEYTNEVRDTIQALLTSLEYDKRKPQDNSSADTDNVPISASDSSAKGKAKETFTPNIISAVVSSEDTKETMAHISTIENRFYALEDEFIFPENVEFTTLSSTNSVPAISRLSYTATNQPVRFHEQSLSHLLARLDSVESHGNEELRKRRKDVVNKVELALEELEQQVERRWNARVSQQPREVLPVVLATPHSPSEGDAGKPDAVFDLSKSVEEITEVQKMTPADQPLSEELSDIEPANILTQAQVPEYKESAGHQPTDTLAEIQDKEETPSQVSGPMEYSEAPQTEESQLGESWLKSTDDQATEAVTRHTPEPVQALQPTSVCHPELQGLSFQADLSATIRPQTLSPIDLGSTAAVCPAESLSSETESDSELGSEDGEFLMENETDSNSKHEDIEVHSTASDWSELDIHQ